MRRTGASPLYKAVETGYVDILKVLIKEGGNVNQTTTNQGVSPLWMASQEGNTAIVKVLLKAGGAVNQARTDDVSTHPLCSDQKPYRVIHCR